MTVEEFPVKKPLLTALFGLFLILGLCAAISEGPYFPYANCVGVGLMWAAVRVGRRLPC